MPLFGITGGIASGKSSFTERLASLLRAKVFDTDACARELLSEDLEVRELVYAAFGSSVFSPEGVIRRELLRERVFADDSDRRALEGILHPRIRRRWMAWAEENLQSPPNGALLVQIPLLFETGAEPLFDCVILVACTPATQERRLAEHRHLSRSVAGRIIASQLDSISKIRRSHHVIWNEASEACLEAQAAHCARYLQGRFALSAVS